MSIELKADVYCDHKGCCNKTTSDNVSISTYSEYGHEYPYAEINCFNDAGWTHKYCRGAGEHYCPDHKPKEKKVKK
jgi:hypothetical protein